MKIEELYHLGHVLYDSLFVFKDPLGFEDLNQLLQGDDFLMQSQLIDLVDPDEKLLFENVRPIAH